MHQKVGTTMQERKPVTRLFRVYFRLLITLVGALCLSWLALVILMRLKWVNDRVRLLSKRGNVLARKIAGTPLGSLYFNLSALKHVGRNSGREYVTPLSAYPRGDGFVLAQTYPNADWCRNVMAAGKCTLIWKEQEYALEKPEILPAAVALRAYPLWVRFVLTALGTKQYVWLHRQCEVAEMDVADR